MIEEKDRKLKLTIATKVDISELLRIDILINRDLKTQNKSHIYFPDITEQQWLDNFNNPNIEIYLISFRGANIGNVTLVKISKTEIKLEGIVILPEYRKKDFRFGKESLEQIIEKYKLYECKQIILEVHPENNAKQLYLEVGFIETEEFRINRFGEKIDIMILNLK